MRNAPIQIIITIHTVSSGALLVFEIAQDTRVIQIESFLFLNENICCGDSLEAPHLGASDSLEAPHWGASNESPQLQTH